MAGTRTDTPTPDAPPAAFNPQPKTLRGDIREAILDTLRHLDKPWSKMTELEQRRVIQEFDRLAGELISKGWQALVDYPFPTIDVSIGDFGRKESMLTAKMSCADSNENLISIARAGRAVLFVATPEVFHGQRRRSLPEPDQGRINLGDDVAHDPETGEVLGETEPLGDAADRVVKRAGRKSGAAAPEATGTTGGLPAEEAERRFTEANAAKEAGTKARRTRATTPEPEQEPAREPAEAATA